jgi:hypothetical protein
MSRSTYFRVTCLVLTLLLVLAGNLHLHPAATSAIASSHPLSLAAAGVITGGNAIVQAVSGVACGVGIVAAIAFPPAGALLWLAAGTGLAAVCVTAFLG